MLRASLVAAALSAALVPAGVALAQQSYETQRPGWGAPSGSAAQQALRGHSVADLQRALAQAGYNPGPVDGAMGPSTRAALTNFQRDMGLRVTGEPTPEVVAALERRGLLVASAPQDTARTGGWQDRDQQVQEWQPSPRDIVEIQRGLAEAGYYRGPLHGNLDLSTRNAIADAQQDLGQRRTGEPNLAFVEALQARGLMAAAPTQPAPAQQAGDAAPATAEPDPELVTDIQTSLQARGYTISEASGELDAETRAAIRAFQRRQGLPATGQPTPELLALIETNAQSPTEMTDAEVIRQIQVRLHNRGYEVGTIDGRLGDATADAIAAYQRDRGLQPTGQASRELLADLQQADAATAAQAEAPVAGEDQPQDIFRILGERALQELGGGQQQQ